MTYRRQDTKKLMASMKVNSLEMCAVNNLIFVGVVYNNFTDTLDFCNSILAISSRDHKSISCVLIDNSDKPEISILITNLANDYDFVTIIRPEKNLGYFGAFNYFFKIYNLPSDSSVVLCNNDLVFEPDFFEKFSSTSYPDDAYVICPNVITLDGAHQNPHVKRPISFMHRLKLDIFFSNYLVACTLQFLRTTFRRLHKSSTTIRDEPSGYIHMGIGACYVIRPVFLAQLKELIYPYFLYGEEAFLSRQVHLAGGRLYYDASLTVHHKESATLSKIPSSITYGYARAGYWTYRSFY